MATLFGQGNPVLSQHVIIRTITVMVFLIIFVPGLNIISHVAFTNLAVLPIIAWTILIFVVIWLVSMLELLIFRLSHYVCSAAGWLEIRSGFIRLHSFVVTPAGFGDLLVYQSIGGRIFGYGNITVNSQGERETKL